MDTAPSSDGTTGLPLSSLRLLVPPVRLLSAFAWQVVQQSLVLQYDRLADLVGLVTGVVPELLGPRQQAELILGLRARLILELCKADGPENLHRIQDNLEKIHECSAQLCSIHQERGVKTLETSYTNFSQLVLKLLSIPSEKEHFLKKVFPVHYGQAYDQTLRRLVSEFLSRLEQLLPTPTLTQVAGWLADPSAAEELGETLGDASSLETLLLHHRQLGCLGPGSPRQEENTITATLALPPPSASPVSPEPDGRLSDGGGNPGGEESRDRCTGRSADQRPEAAQPTMNLKIHLHKIRLPHTPTSAEPGRPWARRRPQGRRAAVDGATRKGQRKDAHQGAEPAAMPAKSRRRRKGVEEKERAEEEEKERAAAAAAAAEEEKEKERARAAEEEDEEERVEVAAPRAEDRRFLSARPASARHSEEETRCPRCDKTFQLPNQLKTHLKLHALPYRCLPCEKGFGSKSGFYQHQRLHRKGRAFPCGRCPLTFLCGYSLRQHERTHAAGPAHLCPECGKSFSGVSMARHLRMHAGQRDYLCTHCGKAFLSSGELLLHTRTHTGDMPYTCTLCGKAFTTKSHLVVHGRSHTGERPYPCALCPKRFLTVSCLKRHMLSHDGVRPFRCPKCPKEFSQNGNLKKHLNTHLNTPPPPPGVP